MCGSCLLLVGACEHRLDDVVISGATAQVAFESDTNFFFGWIWIFIEKSDCSHDHSWCAESALETVVVHECLLHWVHDITLSKTFDGGDSSAVCLRGKQRAALYGFSVEVQ
jgi:hypothetical protein